MRSGQYTCVSRMFSSIILLLWLEIPAIYGFSASQSPDIQIVGMPGGAPQMLPASYIKSLTRWSIEFSGDDGKEISVEKLKGADSNDDDNGFVNPTSTLELWWPSDIDKLQARPTLDILLQRGTPVYASGGMDIRVPPDAAADGMEWRNYGMNSQPLARQWTTFGFAIEPNFRVETFWGEASNNKDEGEETKKVKWECLKQYSAADMTKTLELFAEFISEIDEESPLISGFHVVSIPMGTEWFDLPKGTPYALVSLATAEPDAEELLTMDTDLVAMTATSILGVEVSQIEAGGKSKYLPEAYKPLYV